MSRNFAQILFLAYMFCILAVTRKHLIALILRRVKKEVFQKHQNRDTMNRYFFFSLKKALPPLFYYANLYLGVFLLFVTGLHFLIGWFTFAALFLKILDCLLFILIGLYTFFLSCLGNTFRFGTPLILYRPDNDPNTERAFYSSLLDGLVYGVLPLAMSISVFFLENGA